MRKLLMALALLTGCVAQMRPVNHVGLGIALAETACDWGQTSWAMGAGGYTEENTTLGTHPSQFKLGAYMVGSMALTTVAWYLLPERLKPLAWGIPLMREGNAVRSNMGEGAPLCGISTGPATLRKH